MKKTLLTAAAIAGMSAMLVGAPAMAADGLDLAKAKNCLSCHAVDKKVIGPSYKEIAAKFADDDGAVATLADAIKNGSSGVWGAIPMPPNNVTDDEAKELAEWVMSLN